MIGGRDGHQFTAQLDLFDADAVKDMVGKATNIFGRVGLLMWLGQC